ncbi:hypothetical protein [Raoultella sp. C349492]|uniref:hypothetical protein n=1 Tax=Raoultella sp. C349492 TaxID=2970253 RepID=UPI0035C73AC0
MLISPSGAEQRIARRLSPRRTYEFTVQAGAADARALETQLFHAGSATWDMPIFPDVAVLATSLAAGSLVIPVSTEGRDFVVGDNLLLKWGFGMMATMAVAQIQAIAADGVTVTTPVSAWPQGTLIYPLRPAVITDTPAITRHSDSVMRVQLRCRLAAHNPYTPVNSATVYRGHPVLEQDADWVDDLTAEYQRLQLELDNEYGIPYRTDTAGRAFVMQQHVWSEIGRTAQARLRGQLYHLRGRQRAIWVASQARDFIPVGASGSTLAVAVAGFSEFGVVPGRRDLRLQLADGTRIYRRILTATLQGDHELLALDDVVPDVATISNVSLMALCRQNTDDITWEHATDADGFAQVSTTFRGLRDELE